MYCHKEINFIALISACLGSIIMIPLYDYVAKCHLRDRADAFSQSVHCNIHIIYIIVFADIVMISMRNLSDVAEKILFYLRLFLLNSNKTSIFFHTNLSLFYSYFLPKRLLYFSNHYMSIAPVDIMN